MGPHHIHEHQIGGDQSPIGEMRKVQGKHFRLRLDPVGGPPATGRVDRPHLEGVFRAVDEAGDRMGGESGTDGDPGAPPVDPVLVIGDLRAAVTRRSVPTQHDLAVPDHRRQVPGSPRRGRPRSAATSPAGRAGRGADGPLKIDCRQPRVQRRSPRHTGPCVANVERLEVGHVHQLSRDYPRQVVIGEVYARDPAIRIRGQTVPRRKRLVAQPVGVVRPVRTSGRVVEHPQSRLVLGRSHLGRNHSGQLISPECQLPKRCQVHQPRWNFPAQLIAPKNQPLEVGQVPQIRRDRSRQLIVLELQPLEAGQAPQLGRDRPGQLILVEIQIPEAGQVPQLHRDHPAQLIAPKNQPLEAGQVPQRRRDLPAQLIVLELQPLEAGQAPQLGRDRPGQLIATEIQEREADQLPQLHRDRPAQLIVVESQVCEVGQLPQLHRDRPAQLIAVEIQILEVGQLPQLGRDRPGQLIVVKQ